MQRPELLAGCELLLRSGVVSHSGHANLSTRLSDGSIQITAKSSIRDLDAGDLVVVQLNGEVVAGQLDPINQEIVSMHSVVYRTRPDVGCIIHTHSPHVTAFAVAHQPVPCRYEVLLRFGQAQEIPVVPWAPRGSDASVRGIVEALDRNPRTLAVLLANHGLLAFGATVMDVARLIIALEEAAECELRASMIGGSRPFPEGALEDVYRHMV